LPFTSYIKLASGDDYALCANSDIVIVTAGKKQAEGETRLDLIKANRGIFEDIIPKITKAAPNTLLMIISNPVDVLTYEAQRLPSSGYIWNSDTDTSRLRFHIKKIYSST
jgi:L-lactate dehydrogenase